MPIAAGRSLFTRDHIWVHENQYNIAQRVEDLLGDGASEACALDGVALVGHIARPYSPVPPRSFYRDISSGQIGTRAIGTGPASFEVLWDPRSIAVDRGSTLEDAAHRVRTAIFGSVERMTDGAKVAITLSSGMDSSSVVAAASAAKADAVAVIWAAPTVPEADESSYAIRTARHVGLPWFTIELDPDTLLPDAGIRTYPWTPEFNIYDRAWSNTLEELTSRGLTSIHTGFGGDHLFAGSVSPAGDMLLQGKLVMLARHITERKTWYRSTGDLLRKELAAPIGKQLLRRRWTRRQNPVAWLHPSQLQVWQDLQHSVIGPGVRPTRAAQLGGLMDGIVPQIIEYFEGTLGGRDVAIEHPLLDREVVTAALTVPGWWRDDGRTNKLVLRAAMRQHLPDDVLELRKILPGPISRRAIRARSVPLLDLAKDMRLAELELVDERILIEHVKAFMSGEHDSMDFWNTLTLEDWLRRWK